MTKYEDYPKEELVVGAAKVRADHLANGIDAHVYFKATCPKCGERCMFSEPDMTFDSMECFKCGTVFPFTKGNYMVAFVSEGGQLP
jgi:uncharacterized protein (DUF983 family)